METIITANNERFTLQIFKVNKYDVKTFPALTPKLTNGHGIIYFETKNGCYKV